MIAANIVQRAESFAARAARSDVAADFSAAVSARSFAV